MPEYLFEYTRSASSTGSSFELFVLDGIVSLRWSALHCIDDIRVIKVKVARDRLIKQIPARTANRRTILQLLRSRSLQDYD
jgi:hypothetical protein